MIGIASRAMKLFKNEYGALAWPGIVALMTPTVTKGPFDHMLGDVS